jgi:hypothetical protein
MRLLLIFSILATAPGCSCSFFPLGGDDECSSDFDCDDGNECNGAETCFGWFTLSCQAGSFGCDYGEYCDDSTSTCVVCDESTPWCYEGEPDAGVDAPEPVCWDIGESCDSCSLGCLARTTVPTALPLELADRCSLACDPTREWDDTCGDCAACVDTVRVGQLAVPSLEVGRPPACALRCEPSRDGTGCTRADMSCDPITGTCQDACTTDTECRLVRDLSGAIVEDPASTAICDPVTRRCQTWGTPGARAGDACATDAECGIDGVCLRDGAWPAAGYCTRYDCQHAALACGEGEVCDHRTFDRPSCMRACRIGAEPEEDRLGVDGHGADCAPGFSCRWDGVSSRGACVPGNYNDVLEPNLGARCASDAECYSPYGLGRCAWIEDGFGACTVIDCAVAHSPGLCDVGGAACVDIDGEPSCVRSCASPDDCPSGSACTADGSGAGVCGPSCTSDTECRTNELCEGTDCATGSCRCSPT